MLWDEECYTHFARSLDRYTPWPHELEKTQALINIMPTLVKNYYVPAIENCQTAHPEDDEMVRAGAYSILVGKALQDSTIPAHIKDFLQASAECILPQKHRRVDVPLRYLMDEFYDTLNVMAAAVYPDEEGGLHYTPA